jgi:hypothetical protein
MKKTHSKEIVSFNKSIANIAALIELDDAALEQASGSGCPNLSSCKSFTGDCQSLRDCGTYRVQPD